MSNYGVLFDNKSGLPKWQVFYGDEKPSGEGWYRVSGPLPDSSKTSAKWYRSHSVAKQERAQAEQAKAAAEGKPAPSAAPDKKSFWDKFKTLAGLVKKDVVGAVAPKQPAKSKVRSLYNVGDRVALNDGTVGYIQSVNADGTYGIHNIVTGLNSVVPGADVLATKKQEAVYAPGDAVVVRYGEHAGLAGIVRAVNKQGMVQVDTGSGSQWIDALALTADTKEDEKALKALSAAMDSMKESRGHKPLVNSLLRAARDGRETTTLTELIDDFALTGQKISRDELRASVFSLTNMYKNLRFDPATELLDFGGGKRGLDVIAKRLGVTASSGPYGWSPNPGNGVFSAPGMAFKLPEGTTVTVSGEKGELKAAITSGIIVAHESGAAILEVTDDKGNAYRVSSAKLEREDGRPFWKTATTPDGKAIKPDPFDPSLYGDVTRDNFWILRDRDACRGVEPGDMVKSLPFAIADTEGKYTDEQLVGRVLDRMTQTGLLRVQFDDGRVLDVSPRMVALSRDMKSATEIYQLCATRRSAVYGSTFNLPAGTKLSFGTSADVEDVRTPQEGDQVMFMVNGSETRGEVAAVTKERGKTRYTVTYKTMAGLRSGKVEGLNKNQIKLLGKTGMPQMSSTLRVSYRSKAHFDQAYSELFVKGGESGWLSKMFSNQTADMFSGKEEDPPFLPNQALMRTIMQLYPAADAISARSYHDPGTKELVVEIGPGKSVGQAFSMSDILPKVFPTPPAGEGAIRIDDLMVKHPANKRIDISSDGNSLYVRVGDALEGDLKILDPLKPSNAKQVKLYHAVTASKRRVFELLGKKDPELFHAISRFTYDPAGKRFVADLSDYGENGTVLKGLRKLFGEKTPMFETTDRAWWFPAGQGPATQIANSRSSIIEGIRAAKHQSELAPIKDFGHKKHKLFKVQNEVVNFLTAPGQNTALLANDQGTGKTPIITAAMLKWRESGDVKRGLIVVPASITGNWKEEVEAWTGVSPEFAKDNLVILAGSDRKQAYAKLASKNPPLLTVVSYDTLLQDYKELSTIQWDAMALDEAQNIKNLGTKREKIIKKVFSSVPRRIAATGTAIENSPTDLYSIMEFLQPDIFGSQEKFENDFIEFEDVDAGGGKMRTVPVGVKNIGLLRSRLLPIMVRVDKEKMHAAMNEEIGPQLKAEFGKDIKLMGERVKYPWPVLQKRPDGKFEATFARDEDKEHLIKRDEYNYADYWDAQDKAVEYLMQADNKSKNPLAHLIYLQQAADDPALFAAQIGDDNPKLKRYFERFDERNPDGTFKYKNPKREKMLDEVRRHFADPKNGKIIIFSQSTTVLDKIQDWLYSDPDVRKRLGMGDKAFQDYLATRKLTKTPGLLRYTGGMKSGMVKADAADIVRRLSAGEAADVDTEAAKKERAYVRHAFQEDPSTKILLASDAAQTGLTLTAANKVINYNLGWNPKAMDQRIDRAHRIDVDRAKALADQGGARDVTAVNIIAQGTVDERKMPNLAWKDHLFDLIVSGQAAVDNDMVISAHNESNYEVLQRMNDEMLARKQQKSKTKARESASYGYKYIALGGQLKWL